MKTAHYRLLLMACCAWLCSSIPSGAQGVNNIWMFGRDAGLDFSLGSPVAITTTTPFIATEGCASVCNAAGSLLFYTEGASIRDHNNDIMPNGSNISPANALVGSTSQAAAIVPVPGNANRYYVFALEEIGSVTGNLYYSQVDMSLNGGLGDVMPGQKAILLASDLTEKMTVAIGKCGTAWLVVRSRNVNEYRSYRINSTGLNTAPVISPTGNGLLSTYASGVIKFTPDGKKMAAALLPRFQTDSSAVELYDFDNNTGTLSNAVTLDKRGNSGVYYSVCFSPDGTKLYSGLQYPHQIDQYDVSLATPAAIRASKTTVGTVSDFTGDLKNGPDGKLYIVPFSKGYLACINAPNNTGLACGFNGNAVALNPSTSTLLGLPNVIVNTEDNDTLTSFRKIAGCTSVDLSPAQPATGNCLWSTGATTTQITVTTPGIYWVQYGSTCSNTIDSFEVTFSEPPVLSLGSDTTICDGQTLNLTCRGLIPQGFVLSWSTGAGNTPSIAVKGGGTYWVKASLPPCSSTDSLQVTTKNCDCFFNMPTAFSPNGDGLNDVLLPVFANTCASIGSYMLQVYNRWGAMVFQSFNPAEGWKGTYREVPSELGTYFYLLSFTDYKGQRMTKKGDVMLIR